LNPALFDNEERMNSSTTPVPGIRARESSPQDTTASFGNACGMYAIMPFVSGDATQTYFEKWVPFHTSIGALNAEFISSRFKKLPEQNAIEMVVVFSNPDAFVAWVTAPYMQPYREAVMPLYDMELYAKNPPVIWGGNDAVVALFAKMQEISGVKMRYL
jgi:hypothetical protein